MTLDSNGNISMRASNDGNCAMCGRWSWTKFITGFINQKFLAWIVYTVIQFIIIHKALFETGIHEAFLKSPAVIVLCSGWVTATVVWIMGLKDAIATMISNAKLNVDLKAGASVDVKKS